MTSLRVTKINSDPTAGSRAADRPAPGTETRMRSLTPIERGRDYLGRYGLLIVLAAFVLVFSVLLPNTFATLPNLTAIVNSQALVLLLALTATIVLRAGNFDLSIASLMTFTAAVAAVMTRDGYSLLIIIGIALASGLVVGIINGYLVVRIGVSSFVATLGMMTALGGLAYAITNSAVVYGISGPLLSVARDNVLGFPLLTWYAWILTLVVWYVYERTPLGRYLLFVGGSPESARLAGLAVDRIKIGTFLTSSLLASLCGILLAGYLAGLDPSVGPGYLLPPFVGAFLGATTISVGRFNAMGTMFALYLLAVVITGLQLLGAAFWVTNLFNGAALVVAVTLARLVGRRKS